MAVLTVLGAVAAYGARLIWLAANMKGSLDQLVVFTSEQVETNKEFRGHTAGHATSIQAHEFTLLDHGRRLDDHEKRIGELE